MKTIYLHIGYNKTGTTALQNSFFFNRKQLLNDGLFYPSYCRGKRKSKAHHSLAESLLFKIGIPLPRFVNKKIYSKYPFDHYWKILLKELSETACNKIFISSEAFSRLRGHSGQMRFIREQLAGYEVKILVYLRNQVEYFESAYNQAVKKGGETRTADQLINSGWMSINYFEEIEQWSSIFGTENIIVRIYDRKCREAGIIRDVKEVLQHEGINVETNHWSKRYFALKWNIRLPNSMVERKRRMNTLVRLPRFLDIAVNLYLNWKGKYKSNADLFSREQKEKIILNNIESNRKLGEKYLNGHHPFEGYK